MITPAFWWKNHRLTQPLWTTSKLDQGILHRHRKSLIWILAWWLLGSCGWWDPKEAKVDIPAISSSEVTDLESTRMKIASVSIWSIPTSAPFEVEGKLGYGWIYFEHPISWYANGPYVNPYQLSSYNPRDVLSRLGSTEWIIVRASFSYELDRDNNGVIDSSWTPLNTSMSMLIHRSTLERGEKIIFSPKAALLSDLIRSRAGSSISKEALDSIARVTISEDGNSDGIIDYRDIVSGKTWTDQYSRAINAVRKRVYGRYLFGGQYEKDKSREDSRKDGKPSYIQYCSKSW